MGCSTESQQAPPILRDEREGRPHEDKTRQRVQMARTCTKFSYFYFLSEIKVKSLVESKDMKQRRFEFWKEVMYAVTAWAWEMSIVRL